MTKQELFDVFGGVLTKASIMPESDGDYVLNGRFCIIAPIGNDMWDVWICNSKDLSIGLGERKLSHILSIFDSAALQGTFTRLTGEAYGVSGGYRENTQ